jgi:hypothetical protein
VILQPQVLSNLSGRWSKGVCVGRHMKRQRQSPNSLTLSVASTQSHHGMKPCLKRNTGQKVSGNISLERSRTKIQRMGCEAMGYILRGENTAQSSGRQPAQQIHSCFSPGEVCASWLPEISSVSVAANVTGSAAVTPKACQKAWPGLACASPC